LVNRRETSMSDKFNPAPPDKHAADPKEAAKADKATRLSCCHHQLPV
jgi:hypothetical protein